MSPALAEGIEWRRLKTGTVSSVAFLEGGRRQSIRYRALVPTDLPPWLVSGARLVSTVPTNPRGAEILGWTEETVLHVLEVSELMCMVNDGANTYPEETAVLVAYWRAKGGEHG